MSSADKQSDVATKRAEESIPDKEKGSGDVKSDTSPHKRSASEINSADDGEVKQKVLKTDHKGKDKENGESEDKYDEGDDDDEDVVPEGEGEDYDDEGDEDGAEEEDDDEDDA